MPQKLSLHVLFTVEDVCPEGLPIILPDSGDEPSVFADLSQSEMTEVIEFLMSQEDLNLVDFTEAQIGDSYIQMIETLRPTKQDVLAYLDGNGPKPERQARVSIYK